MSGDRRRTEIQPTGGAGALNGLRVLGIFHFNRAQIRILVFVAEDFVFPFPHSIQEYLQAHSVDITALVEISVWTTIKKSSSRTYRLQANAPNDGRTSL